MEYSNPKIPEEINYSKENPLKEFFLLVFGIFAVLAIFVASIHLSAQYFAHYIPFKYEAKILPEGFNLGFDNNIENTDLHQKKALYLSRLTERLAAHMDLPAEMQLQVNYLNNETINAAASLNGNIYIFQGLLDQVESENELAMIIAHEIAHIKARHPIKALSSGVIIGLTTSIISGSIDNGGTSSILNSGSTLTSLSFSRSQENDADQLALHALYKEYKHTGGSYDFFARMIKKEHNLLHKLEFLSTHPASEKRVATIKNLSLQINPLAKEQSTLIPLPTFLLSK